MKKNSVIYQIVTDRFDNSEGNLSQKVKDPNYNENFRRHMGGGFKGILNRAQYLKSLGVTHVMISPVQKSKEYHGYLTEDNFLVNPNFGNEKNLKEMVEGLHEKGIKTIVDVVMTHISSNNPIFKEKTQGKDPKDLDWFLFKDRMKNHPKYKHYFGELVFKLTDGNRKNINEMNPAPYLGYFGLTDHPLLNLKNPEVRSWNKKYLEDMVEKFNFDGVRLDSGFIQPKDYIKEINDFLGKKGLDLLVEYWSFDRMGGNCSGICNAEFDIEGTIKLNQSRHNSSFFRDMVHHYHLSLRDSLQTQKILSLDNHDLPRFDGDEKQQKIAATLQFTLPSIPLIYYGNEIQMGTYNNRNDRIAQSRDVMRFDLRNPEMEKFYKNLSEFRKREYTEDAQIGDIQINDNGELLTYSLNLQGKEYYVLLNRENREKPVNIVHLFNNKVKNFDVLSQKHIDIRDNDYIMLDPVSSYILSD